MQVKNFLVTVSVSAVAGAATVFMMSKNSKAYRIANDAAQTIKAEAGRMIDTMSGK